MLHKRVAKPISKAIGPKNSMIITANPTIHGTPTDCAAKVHRTIEAITIKPAQQLLGSMRE